VTAICRLIAVSLAAALAGCATEAFYIPSAGGYVSGGDYTLGYAFTVSSPIRGTDLGVWDSGNDGFTDPHAVGIWTSTGTLLAQTTITAGTPGKLTNGFRYLPIAPFILAPGTYTIGARYKGFYIPNDGEPDLSDYAQYWATIEPAYGVSYLGPRGTAPGAGLKFPPDNYFSFDMDLKHLGFFGPNFWFVRGPTLPFIPAVARANTRLRLHVSPERPALVAHFQLH
jgi:hypothetical protein